MFKYSRLRAANLTRKIQSYNYFISRKMVSLQSNVTYMPKLKKIVLRDFRNIVFQELDFSPNINCVSGDNGEGKTNLLEAIYYLSMTKSPFTQSDNFIFRHGCDSFALAGTYLLENGLESKVSISVDRHNSKKLRRDDKALSRMSSHIGQFPVVLVSPADTALVSDTGEERRRFLNAVLSQIDTDYLFAIQQYNRLLQQRNRLLKESMCDDGLLDAYDAQMSPLASKISEARAAFVDRLMPAIQEFYRNLSGGQDVIEVEYRREKGELTELLRACRERDKILKYTTEGPQRDDFLFYIDGFPLRRCGSQGQQKSFLVSLKFAQYEIMKRQYGFAPILLLDDLFDKLDMNRVGNLLKMVAGNDFGQIFLTDSNKIRLAGIVDALTDDRTYYDTEAGVFTKI